MLTKLQLNGFQKHKDLVLDFDKVTTIVGPTDSGKSSIVRALRWLFLAAPATSSAPVAGGDAYVAATVEGRKVARRKGSENVYYLDDEEFRAFRTTVPDPIAAVLSVQPVNFQNQHDAMYWLSSSSPEVSRQLNELVDLEIIDETLGRVGAQVRKSTTLFEDSESVLSTCLADLKEARAQRQSVEDFKKVQLLYKELAEKEARLQLIAPTVAGFDSAFEEWTSASEHFICLEQLRHHAQVYGSRRNTFEVAKKHIREIELLKAEINRYKDIPSLQPIEDIFKQVDELDDQTYYLEEAIFGYEKQQRIIAKYEGVSTEGLDVLAEDLKTKTKILLSLQETVDRVLEAKATVQKFEGLSFTPLAEELTSLQKLQTKFDRLEMVIDEYTLDNILVTKFKDQISELSKSLEGTCLECGRPYE